MKVENYLLLKNATKDGCEMLQVEIIQMNEPIKSTRLFTRNETVILHIHSYVVLCFKYSQSTMEF